MQYRQFGKLDWESSILGFGAMRLPMQEGSSTEVNVEESIKMMRYAIDNGVNYLDTAYPYHGGKSETIVGQVLKDGYREKVKLATKMPTWLINSKDDCDRYLEEQLERLQIDKIDFYLLHGLGKERWLKIKDIGVIDWAEKAMANGYFGRLGFSFHDDYDAFKMIVDGYDNWILSQIQYNYMDIDFQAGTKGLKYAAGKGLAIVVMEPLRGGRLSSKPPSVVDTLWQNATTKRTPADWAFQWVWSHPEVSVALSGMSTMQQVVENVASAKQQQAGYLTDKELALIGNVREAYRDLVPIPCTYCRYCMPCPNGVEIPAIFGLYNEAIVYDDPRTGRFRYRGPQGLKEEQRADNCTECNECVDACPQDIDIPDWLKKAHELLGPK